MKEIYLFKYLFTLLLIAGINAVLDAQNFKLIDINKTKNSNPDNYQNSSKQMFAELDGVFYFSANDGVHGNELYRSNGEAEGTRLVKDIYPGTTSSNPSNIIVSGENIYFLATDSTNYDERLWVSDGTDSGTKSLNYPGPGMIRYLQNLTDVNGSLYFIYSYVDRTLPAYNQLWKTNGTDSGTVIVANLNRSNPLQLINVSGILVFTIYDDTTNEFALFKSNGTAEGTTLVANINPNNPPSNLTVLNGLLYFAADNETGNELWVSDGTAAGTHAVKISHNIYLPMRYEDQVDPFTIKNNTLFFQGYELDSTTLTSSGYELCRYNTSDTNNNVELIKDIIPGEKSSYPSYITDVNGTLFFTIAPDSADAQLWKSDGTKAGTVLVKGINPGGKNIYSELTNVNGTLLFAYGNDASGTELWKSNGTSAGTVLVKDISPGTSGSDPGVFTYKNGVFLFRANGPKGNELWRTNGIEDSTVMVKDINNTSTSSSYPAGFTATNNRIIFSANNEKDPFIPYFDPFSLFITDGSDAGTKPVGSSASDLQYSEEPGLTKPKFINFKNGSYFSDDSNRIWKTNGTKAGTSVLPIPAFVDSGYEKELVATEKLLYIVVLNYGTGYNVLWRTDGTAAGTYVIKSDLSFDYNSYPTAVGNILFFSSIDGLSAQLWKTDGTLEGTKIVKTTGDNNKQPTNLYNFNGKLYFKAPSTTNGSEQSSSIWTSDGTETGTTIVKDGPVSNAPFEFAQAKGKLIFLAYNTETRRNALFASDGAAAGTRVVKDINKDSISFLSLISGDTVLYFVGYGPNGPELWKSDGTNKGTIMVKNIAPGSNVTYLENIVNANDKLFFTVKDTLWQSDATEANTHPVVDDNLRGVTQITNLTAIGDSLYFSGYTYAAGQELYVGKADINNTLPVTFLNFSGEVHGKQNLLYWTTATEQNNTGFEMQRRSDGNNFSKIGFINTKAINGNSTAKLNYDFIDVDYNALTNYYRLKQIDKDGKFSYSNIVVLKDNNALAPGSITIYPNPVMNVLSVKIASSANDKVTLLITDINGKTIVNNATNTGRGESIIQMNISHLSAGTYFLRAICGSACESGIMKFVKQ